MHETMELTVGDEILLRLRDGLDTRMFGTGWRIGTITALGVDLLADEPVIQLDDDGPRIYSAHIAFVSLLRRHDEPGTR